MIKMNKIPDFKVWEQNQAEPKLTRNPLWQDRPLGGVDIYWVFRHLF